MSDPRDRWQRLQFGAVVRLCKERCVDPIAHGVERYVGLEHMEPGNLRLRTWGDVADGTTFTTRFKAGQVLFGKRRAYQRKVALADFAGVCSGDIYVFEVSDPTRILPDLLPFVCLTEAFFDRAIDTSAGSLSPRTNWSSLAAHEFALPPLQDQGRFYRALSAAEDAFQRAYDLTHAAASAVDAFAAAAFRGVKSRQMVTHPRLGLVARDWPVVTIGALTDSSQYGLSLPPETRGQYPILRMMNLVDGHAVENDIRFVDLSDETFSSYRIESGDVLFNRTNSIDLVGRTGVYTLEGEHVFASYLVRLKVKRELVNPEYLTAYLNAPLGRQQVLSYATKAVSQANVSASNLAKVLIPLPPRDIQDRIVTELSTMRRAQTQAQEHAQRATDVKNALIRRLSGST